MPENNSTSLTRLIGTTGSAFVANIHWNTVHAFGIVWQMKIEEPDTITCYFCSTPGIGKKHRVETSKFVRVLWHCAKCGCEYWKDYGDKESARERKKRWH